MCRNFVIKFKRKHCAYKNLIFFNAIKNINAIYFQNNYFYNTYYIKKILLLLLLILEHADVFLCDLCILKIIQVYIKTRRCFKLLKQ